MENKKLQLSNGEQVEILSQLTWGQKETINNIFIKGAKFGASGLNDFDASVMVEGKYKALEICVVTITRGEETKPFSKEWIDNLSVDDGDLVFNTVNELTTPKKKVEIAN